MRSVAADRVVVFDTTLRDGEQAPGFSMGVPEKLKVAVALRGLGVDIIEAGFAAASPGDEAAIRVVAEEIEGPVICSLARAFAPDIEAAARALEPAKHRRVHIFLATSPIHREAKLKMSCAEVLHAAEKSVAFARTFFEDVEFSAEDAIRTEPEFLIEVLQAAADAGARTLNVPDTVGYSTPDEIGKLFRLLAERVRTSPGVRFSAHCHNDLGMAVANSLAAVQAGARQVECTINGIGERAGNCSMEELVMALRTRSDLFGIETNIDSTRLVPASRLLSRVTKSPLVRNKAVVGRNAFAHEAGIHQHGVLEDARTYEVMRPQDVGFNTNELVLGKHSGRHALAKRAREMGFDPDEATLTAAFAAFKRRADEIGALDDDELRAIFVNGEPIDSGLSLARLEVRTEHSGKRNVAIVELARSDGERITRVGIGETALESAFLAVRQDICPMAEVEEIDLLQFGYGAGSEAEAETLVRVGDARYRGHGRGPDPLWAGVRAFIHALNKAQQAPSADHAAEEDRNEAAG